ncbi:MAG TPA: hypothetical protein GX497_12155 [Bacillus bacterium]|nr:hypothetical protein [Bacillus sp. (in: firmicutes)]
MENIICFKSKKDQFTKKLHTEVSHLIDDLMDQQQQTVAWILYYSMRNEYPIDVVGFSLELWYNFCNEIDPFIDDERKYAASIEMFVSNLLNLSTYTKHEILHKYGLHKIYDPETIEV